MTDPFKNLVSSATAKKVVRPKKERAISGTSKVETSEEKKTGKT